MTGGPPNPLVNSAGHAFVMGVAALDQLPEADMPEVAFAGRSNVGKSSLINALTGRRDLARTSHTPGRTQQLNFFDIAGLFYLVDMPGYGYAQVSKARKAEWERLIRDYLRGRPNLRCVFLLVDSRHGLKDIDRDLMTMLDETAVPYRVILTKSDKTKSAERDKVTAATAAELKKHTAAWPAPFLVSAHEGHGVDELRAIVMDVAAAQAG